MISTKSSAARLPRRSRPKRETRRNPRQLDRQALEIFAGPRFSVPGESLGVKCRLPGSSCEHFVQRLELGKLCSASTQSMQAIDYGRYESDPTSSRAQTALPDRQHAVG